MESRLKTPRARWVRVVALLLPLLHGACGAGPPSTPTDGGASDGGAVIDGGSRADGGALVDGGASDGGASDGGASDGGVNDGGVNDGGVNDGGVNDGGATFSMEVGTGQFTFVPVDGGVEIVCGPQGGQHIWTSVRAAVGTFEPRNANVTIQITRSGSSELFCGASLQGLDFFPNDGGTHYELAGVICFVADPLRALGQLAVLDARISDARGRTGHATSTTTILSSGGPCLGAGNDGGVDAGLSNGGAGGGAVGDGGP